MIALDSRIETVLGGRGDKVGRVRERLGLLTVEDLLRHFPRRYLELGRLTRVEQLQEGDHLSVVGRVESSAVKEYHDRRTRRTAYRVDVRLGTDGPSLRMSFFARNRGAAQWHCKRMQPGVVGVFLGRVDRFRGEWQLANARMVTTESPDGPELRDVSDAPDDVDAAERAVLAGLRGLFPLYPTTAKVESWDLQRGVAFALSVVDELPDPLPADLLHRRDLPDLRRAYELVHQPATYAEVQSARRRFRYEEALVVQLVLAGRRRERGDLPGRVCAGVDAAGRRGGLLDAFDARLPFELTDGQRAVGEQIAADLAGTRPMNRLLQGEVGSGKTVVALRAMLRVVDSGAQAALLAPTEVLAAQHHRSITAMLGDLAAEGLLGGADEATTVTLLTGSMGTAQRRRALSQIASGEAGLVIGTHALLQDTVGFAELGLLVVDEQHRFGVEQRAALADRSIAPPHVLVMTATPIPRTVAMTVFGDLETSTLRELPAGRADVQTTVVPLLDQPTWGERIWQRVREEVGAGHQVYVVCPRISAADDEAGAGVAAPDDAGAAPSLAAVEETLRELAEGPLAGLRLAALHGRLPADEKERVMRDYAAGRVDVLVSTTVIEVGVDVRNATTMVVLDADRFGVSQLHQLRGRIGRGDLPGLCLLVTSTPMLSPARERLAAVAATRDGFELAEADLEQRREGDVLGAAQSGGRTSLEHLRVLRDATLIEEARADAVAMVDDDPTLSAVPALAARVRELALADGSDFLERS